MELIKYDTTYVVHNAGQINFLPLRSGNSKHDGLDGVGNDNLTIWDDIKLCHWVPKGSIFLKIDHNQLSFLFGFYLKIRERKKLERKKVRARPLCHPKQPTHEPFRFIGHINASVP